MSGTMHSLTFSVTTAATDHWTPAHKVEYEYDEDMVMSRLSEVMEKAGTAFVKANPDLFRSDQVT